MMKQFLLILSAFIFSNCFAQQNDAVGLLIKDGKYYEAIDDLDNSLRKDKKNTKLLLKRSEVFYLLKDYRNGLADIEDAMDNGVKEIKYIELAFKGAQKTSDKKRMMKYVNQLVVEKELYRQYAPIKCELLYKNEKYESAYDEVRNYLKVDSLSWSINFLASKCALKLGFWTEALSYINKSISTEKGEVELFLQRGEVHAALEQYAKASLDYSMVLDLDPRSAEAYYQRGELKEMMQDFDGACADYQNAVQYKHPFAGDKAYEFCKE